MITKILHVITCRALSAKYCGLIVIGPVADFAILYITRQTIIIVS